MKEVYFKDAYEDYQKHVKHTKLNISFNKIDEFSKLLKNGENLTISRFNDGEWAFSLGIKHWVDMKIKTNHPTAEIQLKYAGLLLKEVLDNKPEYYVSVDSFSLTNKKFKNQVEPYLGNFINRIGGGVFNIWSLYTGFKDLFEIFKKRDVLLVGPEFLSKLPFNKYHIKTDPKTEIYNIQKSVYEIIRYLDKHYKPNMVIIYSCSFISKITTFEVNKIYGNSLTQLDMGASLNPYVEYNNRPWFNKIIEQLNSENFYKKFTIHHTSYVEDDVEIGDNVHIGPFSIVRRGAKIGNNCSFSAYCEIRENVIIGDNTKFGSRCTISANATIGSNNTIKYGFVLTDTPDLKDGNNKNVGSIGNGVLIGANVTLMPGFNIGNNSIIGACSQVRSNVGDNEIWYGSPAKLYKKQN